MAQLCDALRYAHEEGIVHRDIKPENVLFDKQGRVRIADFGLANLTARTSVDHTLTAAGQVMGTWNYMAPEQLDNPLAVDHRADIYALGVVLYELLTGELPRARFPLPSEKSADIAAFDPVVLRALEREPDRRFQNIEDFRVALEAAARTPAGPSGGPLPRTTQRFAAHIRTTAWARPSLAIKYTPGSRIVEIQAGASQASFVLPGTGPLAPESLLDRLKFSFRPAAFFPAAFGGCLILLGCVVIRTIIRDRSRHEAK